MGKYIKITIILILLLVSAFGLPKNAGAVEQYSNPTMVKFNFPFDFLEEMRSYFKNMRVMFGSPKLLEEKDSYEDEPLGEYSIKYGFSYSQEAKEQLPYYIIYPQNWETGYLKGGREFFEPEGLKVQIYTKVFDRNMLLPAIPENHRSAIYSRYRELHNSDQIPEPILDKAIMLGGYDGRYIRIENQQGYEDYYGVVTDYGLIVMNVEGPVKEFKRYEYVLQLILKSFQFGTYDPPQELQMAKTAWGLTEIASMVRENNLRTLLSDVKDFTELRQAKRSEILSEYRNLQKIMLRTVTEEVSEVWDAHKGYFKTIMDINMKALELQSAPSILGEETLKQLLKTKEEKYYYLQELLKDYREYAFDWYEEVEEEVPTLTKTYLGSLYGIGFQFKYPGTWTQGKGETISITDKDALRSLEIDGWQIPVDEERYGNIQNALNEYVDAKASEWDKEAGMEYIRGITGSVWGEEGIWLLYSKEDGKQDYWVEYFVFGTELVKGKWTYITLKYTSNQQEDDRKSYLLQGEILRSFRWTTTTEG